jgi:hypothetical protein
MHSLSRLRQRAGERMSPQWNNLQEEKALSRKQAREVKEPAAIDST